MQGSPCLAYSLCQEDDGWRWSVYDQDGVTIAGGADLSRDAAQAAVDLTLRRAEAQPCADRSNSRRGQELPNIAMS